MNYRHAYHAGNFADVVKHAVLARILDRLGRKDAPYRVLDTHAGVGLYDLAADEALKTGEWRGGVGRVLEATPSPALAEFLAPWRQALREVNGGDHVLVYPGSPAVATALGRPQDRFVFNELHPIDADQLAATFARDRRVRVTAEDGWIMPRAQLPPEERRGVLVVDPPFEEAGEFDRLVRAMRDAHRRFATGVQLLWYPAKGAGAVADFHAAVAAGPVRRVLRIDHWIRRPTVDGPLAGAGMLVVNPPWPLADEIAGVIDELAALLAAGPGARGRVDWLVDEDGRPAADA
ncbi:23S rRNA (adenine(2030)-N(6))-methyltransferase RlmJ [Oharaeibacter diazotrophicus]|uniref:Ribosomal RNA large subunit methyltransferase J n=1 Tax=Oharaeibacter diazotrophicus TaxID=1920512 RepID=A0A4V6PVE1_9HYPH|nr:23S rRNA (adenine(2030)-N(6))-methyltransferase RlmJ [Oharaeibacter diazotrophicus]TDP82638.1 23S rRNA (adenine2030-N6)-methyltransferase [Oharaeibacter diazotrophicus]BBE72598.1 ribosomal RNA large subunit methyltransferase J [Pleomorphomonas sp. SM30]GLS76632.1 ribosomal RNA large subunit methyltransferase J [Oharaeibacter diazotrophicus]